MKGIVILSVTIAAAFGGTVEPHRDAALRHFYYVDGPAALRSLQENRDRIDLVSPVWFAVGRGGKLESSLDSRVMDWAAAHNLPVMPVLVNRGFDAVAAHDLLTTPRVRDDLLIGVLKIAALHHFYGIQLDFENIPPADRDAYSNFAQSLGRGLHNLRMKMGVAVMSPFGPRRQGDGAWEPSPQNGAFDYFQLAAEADLVSLMAYDQHTSPDSPGPIAGSAWVEACIRKVLECVPSRKLLLGVPLYYRQWNNGAVAEGPFTEAQALASRNSSGIDYDAQQEECTFRFQDAKGTHTVWLYDARALNARLKLAAKYHLRGISAWRLGQEDPLFWERQ